MFIILLGDPNNGNIEYIGVFHDPIEASTYAQKHLKKMQWTIAILSMKQD